MTPVPGDDFDSALRAPQVAVPLLGRARRTAVRDRLRAAAVDSVARTSGLDRDHAREVVAAGTWTDPWACAFLGGTRGPGYRARLAALLAGITPFVRGARRTAEAIADRDEAHTTPAGTVGSGDSPGQSSTDGPSGGAQSRSGEVAPPAGGDA